MEWPTLEFQSTKNYQTVSVCRLHRRLATFLSCYTRTPQRSTTFESVTYGLWVAGCFVGLNQSVIVGSWVVSVCLSVWVSFNENEIQYGINSTDG